MVSLKLHGNVWKFGEEIDTGQIIPGRYVPLTDPEQLAKHVFEDVAPEFTANIQQGDIIVAGRNFGCGSSREHAPKGLIGAGISAVVADSFARIFYRNSLNLGLFVIEIPGISAATEEGDIFDIDMEKGKLSNLSKGLKYSFSPYEDFIMDIIKEGGVMKYTLKKLLEENLSR